MAIVHLYNAPSEQIARYDLAEMNLISAKGLPGAEDLDIAKALQTLDEWAAHIRKQTARVLPYYLAHRDKFESRAQFNMTVLIQTLTRDFGIRYNPDRISDPDNFDDPADSFIHGLLGPKRMGTCATLPVLLVSLGRHLGYPLKLVLSPGHCFCRWDTAEERFNIEWHDKGLNSQPDQHYREWPKAWPAELCEMERQRRVYLISLSPQQELAWCAYNRASQLDIGGRRNEALAAMQVSCLLWPNHGSGVWLTHLATKAHFPDRKWPHLPCEETSGRAAMRRLTEEKGVVFHMSSPHAPA